MKKLKVHCAGENGAARLCCITNIRCAPVLDLPHFNHAVCTKDNSLLCQRCLTVFTERKP